MIRRAKPAESFFGFEIPKLFRLRSLSHFAEKGLTILICFLDPKALKNISECGIFSCIRCNHALECCIWRDGRVVECVRLEIECCESNRGFKSLSLRK